MKFTTSRPHLLCRRANRWLLRASAAVVLATSASQAAVTITISEVGGNLVFTSSGTLDLPNLTPVLTGNYNDDFCESWA